jgi:hypothetical protein
MCSISKPLDEFYPERRGRLGRMGRCKLCFCAIRGITPSTPKAAPRAPAITTWTPNDAGCWIWDGTIRPDGYGVKQGGRGERAMAHRWVYERVAGPIPEGLELDHLCRVRSCVNPDHLEPVTHDVNCQRSATVKLTHDDVREVRRLHAERRLTNGQIADRFGICMSSVWKIATRRTWSNVA